MQTKTNNTLNEILIENSRSHKNLTVFPLIGRNNLSDLTTFHQAINDESLEVSEISDQGSVPSLNVHNKNLRPVFIIDGQTITGKKLKQNRIITVSTLIPETSTMKLSVLCSERGRWSRTDREFASRDSSMFAKARFSKMETMSQRANGSSNESYDKSADQQQTWEQINRKFSSFNDFSSSESMQDIYKNKENILVEFEKELTMPENAVGCIFAIGNRVLGFELFSSHQLFADLYPQLLKSYALDAIERKNRNNNQPSLDDAKKIIHDADNSLAKQCKNSGLGNLFTINTNDICATILMLDDKIIHFTCFSKQMRNEL